MAVNAAQSYTSAKWIVAVVGLLQVASTVINVTDSFNPPFARWTLVIHGMGVIAAYVFESRRLPT